MDTPQAALILFFGLSWSHAVAAISEYRVFETAEIFRWRGKSWQAFSRFIFGNLICNLLPIAILWFLYTKTFDPPQCNHTQSMTIRSLIATAIASISIFSLSRLLHGIIATEKTRRWFYDDTDWEKLIRESGQEENDNPLIHLSWGLAYLFVPIGIAHLMMRCPG